jgi:hypothetical protein
VLLSPLLRHPQECPHSSSWTVGASCATAASTLCFMRPRMTPVLLVGLVAGLTALGQLHLTNAVSVALCSSSFICWIQQLNHHDAMLGGHVSNRLPSQRWASTGMVCILCR